MTEFEKLKRIELYESLRLSQEEIEWRLEKDEHIEDDPWWELIRDQKFRKIDEIPDEEWDDSFLEDERCKEAKKLNESVGNIVPGDVVIVKSFHNLSQSKQIDNRTHHFVIVGDSGQNNIKKKTFFGFGMSSQLEHSNKFNPKESGHIFINNEDSIYQNPKVLHGKSTYINLSDLSEVSYSDIEVKVGHITDEFNRFIYDVRQKICRKEDTANIYWEK